MKIKIGKGVIRFIAVLLAVLLSVGTMLPAAPTARATEGAAYGAVTVLTGAEDCTVSGSESGNTTVSNQTPVELKWSAADASAGRNQDGWWIGIKVMAPEGMTDAELQTVQYKRGNGSIGSFWSSKDSLSAPHYITLWGLINEEYLYNALNGGTHLTYRWEFDWAKSDFAAGKTQIVKLDIDPQNIILKSADGTKQVYPIFGDVSVLTGAETCVVTGNKTSSTAVETPEKIELQWYPADATAGRNQDGWWIGIKVTAPEGMRDAELTTVKYQRGDGSIGSFWSSKDSLSAPHYITLWGLVNEGYLATALNAGTHLSYQWKFDWTGSDFAEDKTQVVTIDIDPQNIVLKKSDDASYQYPADPLYGTLDSLTNGMAVDNSDLTHPTASSIDGGKVELLWAPKDTSIGRNQDGWWVGVKINAPEGMEYDFSKEDNNPVYYQRRVNGGEWSEKKSFNALKDSLSAPHYLTFWMPLTEESWDANQELSYDLRFDWNRDGIYEQTMTVSCVPQDFKLMTQDGMDQVRPHTLGFEVKDGKVTVYNTEYDPGTFYVDYQGDTVTYTIYAHDNHHIVSVKEGDNTVFPVTDEEKATVENQTQKEFTHSFTPTGDITVTAEILIDSNDLTDSEQGKAAGNTVSPLQQTIDYNATGTISIHCEKGYIAEVQTADGTVLKTVNGKDNAVDETYTTGAITEDTELQVVFTPVEYEITYHTPVGTTPDTETYTVEDDTVSLQQLTETGFEFAGWMEKSEDGKVDGTTGSAITAMEPSECRDIDLYAVWTVDTEITAKQGDDEVISGSVTNGAEVTLTISSALEDATYFYTCSDATNVEQKSEGRTNGTIERAEANANVKDIFDVYAVSFQYKENDKEIEFTYAASSTQESGFVLWQDACKPTVIINDIWMQLWLLAKNGIDQARPISAYNSEKSYTLTISDSKAYDSGVATRWYAFVPYNAAAELTEDAVVEQVMEKYNLQWIEITEATTEIKNPEKNPTDGECVLILRAIDQVGNVAYADTEGMLFDNDAPAIRVEYSGNTEQVATENTYYSKDDITATIKIEDAYLVTSDSTDPFNAYTVSVDNSAKELKNTSLKNENGKWVFTGELTFTCQTNQDAKYALTVTARDAAGNTAEAYNATVVVDRKAPTIDVSYTYTNGENTLSASDSNDGEKAKVYSNGDIEATVTIRDAYLDFAQDGVTPTIQLNGNKIELDADKIAWEDGGTEWTATFTISSKGDSALSISVSDECGNSTTYENNTLGINSDAPKITVSYDYANGHYESGRYKVEGDNGSLGHFAHGNITVTVTIEDDYLDSKKDGVTPTIELNGNKIELDADKITWKNGGTKWIAVFEIPCKENSYDEYNLAVSVFDDCGNAASYHSKDLRIDTKDPEIESVTIRNTQSAVGKALNFLTFGIFFNGNVEVKVTVRDDSIHDGKNGYPKGQVSQVSLLLDSNAVEGVEPTTTEIVTDSEGKKLGVVTFELPSTYLAEDVAADVSFTLTDAAGNTSENVKPEKFINADNSDEYSESNTFLYETTAPSADFSAIKKEAVSYHDTETDKYWVRQNVEQICFDVLDQAVNEANQASGIAEVKITLNGEAVDVTNGGKTQNTEFTYENQTHVETYSIRCEKLKVGENTVAVTATDNAGNSTTEAYTFVVYKDITEPTTDFSANKANTVTHHDAVEDKYWVLKDTAISFSVTEPTLDNDDNTASGLAEVKITLNGNAVNVSDGEKTQNSAFTYANRTLTDAFSIAYDELSEGKNEIVVTATDNVGNRQTYTFVVYKDITEPTTDFSAIKANAVTHYDAVEDKYWVLTDTAISFSVSDATSDSDNTASGIAKVEITLNGNAVNVSDGEKTQNSAFTYASRTLDKTFSIAYNDLNEGKNVITVTVTDNVGNQKTDTYVVYKDITAPTADFSANKANTVTYHDAVEDKDWVLKDTAISFSVSDATSDSGNTASGIAEVEITLNGEAVRVSNGNKTQNSAFIYASRTLTDSFSIAYDNLNEGKNEVAVTLTDNVGNRQTYTFVVYKDTVAPQIAGISFEPAPQYDEGDESSFTEPTKMQYGFYFNSDTEVTISASDNASGMKEITYYTVDFLGKASERETLTVSANNSISFVVSAGFKGQIFVCPTDNVGNLPMDQNGEPIFTAPDGTVLETQDQHDKIADASIARELTPVSEKDHAGYPLYSGDVPLTITVSDNFAGLREVEWSVKLDETTIESGKVFVDNDGKITSTGGSAVWSGTKNNDDNLVPMLVGKLTVSKEGTGITVYVKLTDRAGNTTEKEEKFSIDRTKPTWNVSYNTPAQTSGGTDYHSSPVTATIRVTELNFDADDFQVKVNGAAAAISGWQQNGAVWTTTVTMSKDGEYIFEVTGEDMAKNVMDPYKSNKKIVDQTAPVCDVTFNQEVQTLNENAYHDGPVTATIRITEQNFNPNDFQVTVNGAAAQITGWAQNGTVWTTSVTMSEDGEYVFEVTGADMARNALTPYKSNTRIVDATKPVIVLDGIKNESANNADTIGFTLTVTDANIQDSDIAPKLTVVNWTGKGIEPASFPEETIRLEKTSATADGQTVYTYTVKNLEKDGFYTLVCTAKDLSGNTFSTILVKDDAKEADAVYFSVNRDGSVFWLETEHTDKYADGKVLHNELFGAYANDTVKVILHEVNVDEVDLQDTTKPSKFTVSNGSLTTEVALVEGENYEKNSRIGAGGWYENTYTLNNDLFAEDGSYSVNLLTYDRAGNSNTNTKEEDGRMQFVVDRTDPVISSNAKTDQRINASDYVLEFNITETNLAEETLAVKINGEPVSTENLIAVGGNTYQYQLTDGLNQTVEIYAKDKAGNESGVYRIDSLTISTNVIVLWYANTPLFWGSIGGVAALTALIAWLIVAKKRKQEKQEA